MNSTSFDILLKNLTNDFLPVTHNNSAVVIGINPPNTVTQALIVKSAFLCLMMIVSIFGNGLVLAAIRTTPSLWTKTNTILASLTVSDFLAGLTMLYYVPSIIITSVVNNPCRYNVMQVVLTAFTILPPYTSSSNLIIVAIDRYVAIVYPLEYETRITDRVVTAMICASWLFGSACAMSFMFWLINADPDKCSLVPVKYFFLDVCIFIIVGAVVVFVYVKILFVAWHHHVAIGQTTAAAVAPGGGQSRLEETNAMSNVVQCQQKNQQSVRTQC